MSLKGLPAHHACCCVDNSAKNGRFLDHEKAAYLNARLGVIHVGCDENHTS